MPHARSLLHACLVLALCYTHASARSLLHACLVLAICMVFTRKTTSEEASLSRGKPLFSNKCILILIVPIYIYIYIYINNLNKDAQHIEIVSDLFLSVSIYIRYALLTSIRYLIDLRKALFLKINCIITIIIIATIFAFRLDLKHTLKTQNIDR